MTDKSLDVVDVADAKVKVSDIKVVGNVDAFQLLFKASSQEQGWMKSTKALYIENIGCVVQASTQQGGNVAEAVTFIPGVEIAEDINGGRKLVQIEHPKCEQKLYIDASIASIAIYPDGDRWCAIIGENLQEGVSGFGEDPIAALSSLYANIRGIEFAENQNYKGDVASVSIVSLAQPLQRRIAPDCDPKYTNFVEAYGRAIASRDEDGMTDRERLLASNFNGFSEAI